MRIILYLILSLGLLTGCANLKKNPSVKKETEYVRKYGYFHFTWYWSFNRLKFAKKKEIYSHKLYDEQHRIIEEACYGEQKWDTIFYEDKRYDVIIQNYPDNLRFVTYYYYDNDNYKQLVSSSEVWIYVDNVKQFMARRSVYEYQDSVLYKIITTDSNNTLVHRKDFFYHQKGYLTVENGKLPGPQFRYASHSYWGVIDSTRYDSQGREESWSRHYNDSVFNWRTETTYFPERNEAITLKYSRDWNNLYERTTLKYDGTVDKPLMVTIDRPYYEEGNRYKYNQPYRRFKYHRNGLLKKVKYYNYPVRSGRWVNEYTSIKKYEFW